MKKTKKEIKLLKEHKNVQDYLSERKIREKLLTGKVIPKYRTHLKETNFEFKGIVESERGKEYVHINEEKLRAKSLINIYDENGKKKEVILITYFFIDKTDMFDFIEQIKEQK